jgi:hypothetical protein
VLAVIVLAVVCFACIMLHYTIHPSLSDNLACSLGYISTCQNVQFTNVLIAATGVGAWFTGVCAVLAALVAYRRDRLTRMLVERLPAALHLRSRHAE